MSLFAGLPVLLLVPFLIQQATALHTLPRGPAAAPSITAAPSPAAVELRFRALNPTATLNIQTCASKCYNSIVTKSTLCKLGDWECECNETNANIIEIGAMECVYAACGYVVGAAVFSEASDFCTSVMNGDFDLPSSGTAAADSPAETTAGVVGVSTNLPYYLPTSASAKASRTSATAPATTGTTSSSSSSSSGSGLSTGELAGTIAGVIGAVAGVISAWFGYRMYKKRHEGRAEEQSQMLGNGYGMTSPPVSIMLHNNTVVGQHHMDPRYQQWHG